MHAHCFLSCSLSVAVEDMTSSCCVSVKVLPHMTVAALKQQVRRQGSCDNTLVWGGNHQLYKVRDVDSSFAIALPLETLNQCRSQSSLHFFVYFQVFVEYGFHPRVQRWVIGQCLCTEPRTLASYGVQKDGDTAYLYLVSARQARTTRQMLQHQDQESAALLGPPPPPGPAPPHDWRGYSTLPSKLTHSSPGEATCMHAHRHCMVPLCSRLRLLLSHKAVDSCLGLDGTDVVLKNWFPGKKILTAYAFIQKISNVEIHLLGKRRGQWIVVSVHTVYVQYIVYILQSQII